MARMRVIKPGMRTSDLVASWPIEQRYFFAMLWGYLDDEGRGLDIPRLIASDCFPHDEKITPVKVDGWLDKMLRNLRGEDGPLCRYQVDGRAYLHAVNWGEHQKPNRPTPSKLPACPLHESRSESSSEPPSGGSTDRVRGVEGLITGEVEDASPPPRRCPQHEKTPTSDPCRACGDARKAREDWDAEQAGVKFRIAAEIQGCRLCDIDGWRFEDGRRIVITPYVKCDHRAVRSVPA